MVNVNDFCRLNLNDQVRIAEGLHFTEIEWGLWFSELIASGDIQFDVLKREFSNKLIREEVIAAREMLSGKALEDAFLRFEQYRPRIEFEIICLERVLGFEPKRIALVGTGAMPITGLYLAENYQVLCIEQDNFIGELGAKVAQLTDSSVEFSYCPGEAFDGYGGFDAIIVSGTVGVTNEAKFEIVQSIFGKLNSNQVLMVRDAMREELMFIPTLKRIPRSSIWFEFREETQFDYMKRLVFRKA